MVSIPVGVSWPVIAHNPTQEMATIAHKLPHRMTCERMGRFESVISMIAAF